MSETTYTVQIAKTSRAKCKTSKETITKGELKILVEAPLKEGANFAMSSSHKISCFKIPRKLTSQGIDVEEFFDTILEDDGELKLERRNEIFAGLREAATKTKQKKPKVSEDGGADTIMDRLKAAVEKSDDGDDEPAKKKKKGSSREEEFRSMLRVYKQYHKGTTASELKDILRWNKQIIGGKKEFALFKVVDGVVNGRLSVCPLCPGNLKFLEDDYEKIHCAGQFDEDIGARIPCSYTTPREKCPETARAHPFYTEEPTEEEKEAMQKLREELQEGSATKTADNPVAQELLEAAKALDIDLSSNKGLKQAVDEFVPLVEGKVDLPKNRNPKMELGKLITANRGKSAEEIMQVIFDKYGFAEDKEEKAAAKEAAAEGACANPKNAGLILALSECMKYYFAEKNTNAALSYQKSIKVLTALEEEVTEENALSFSKGKTKLPGIGAATGKKMLEYVQSGTFAKLEEKRLAHA